MQEERQKIIFIQCSMQKLHYQHTELSGKIKDTENNRRQYCLYRQITNIIHVCLASPKYRGQGRGWIKLVEDLMIRSKLRDQNFYLSHTNLYLNQFHQKQCYDQLYAGRGIKFSLWRQKTRYVTRKNRIRFPRPPFFTRCPYVYSVIIL